MALVIRHNRTGLLQRRVLLDLAQVSGLCLGVLLVLLLVGRMLQLRDLFLALNLGLADLGRLFLYMTPFFLLLLLPIAGMLGVFLTFLRMSTDRELVALRASGLSLYELLPAPAFFCLFLTLVNLLNGLWGISWGAEQFRGEIMDMVKTRTQLVLQPGVFNNELPGLTFYSHRVDNQAGDMEYVFVRDRTRKDMDATIVARLGHFQTDAARGAIMLELHDGRIYQRQGDKFGVLKFGSYSVRIPLGLLVKGYDPTEVKARDLSYGQLVGKIEDPASRDVDRGIFYRKAVTEKQKRLALPFACLVLGLFALPVATAFSGLRQSYGLVLALGMFLLYYTLFSVGVSLGESGTLAPEIGLWTPNLLFLGLAVWGVRAAAREKTIDLMGWLAHCRLFRRRQATA